MKHVNRRNYYRLLHIQHDAPAEVIKASYRTIMQKLKQHPDLGGDPENASFLNDAYATLINTKKRVEYDRKQEIAKKSGYVYRSQAKTSTQKKHNQSARYSDFGPAYCPFCQVSAPGKTLRGDVITNCRVCESPLMPVRKISHEGDSKRSVKRTPVQGQIQFWSSWPQSKAEIGEIQNLSPMGLKFLFANKLPLNSLIKIDSQGLRAVSRVVSCLHSTHQQLSGYSISAEFITLDYKETRGACVSERV